MCTRQIVGWPAFAIDDEAIRDQTRSRVVKQLVGKYGCKRFLRDSYKTALESVGSGQNADMRQFEGIECEWPLFLALLALDAHFRGDLKEAERYHAQLENTLVVRRGNQVVPKLYYVALSDVQARARGC